jgi:hypothetical protein
LPQRKGQVLRRWQVGHQHVVLFRIEDDLVHGGGYVFHKKGISIISGYPPLNSPRQHLRLPQHQVRGQLRYPAGSQRIAGSIYTPCDDSEGG